MKDRKEFLKLAREYEREIYQTIVLLLIFLMYLSYIYLDNFPSLVPELEKPPPLGISLSNTQYGSIVACSTFLYVLFCFFSGFAIDKIGAKISIMAALYIMIVLSCLFAVSTSVPFTWIVYVLLVGFEGIRWNGFTKIIQSWFEEERQGRAFCILAVSNELASFISQVNLSFLLQTGLNWREVSIVMSILSFFMFIVCLITLKERPHKLSLFPPSFSSSLDTSLPSPSFPSPHNNHININNTNDDDNNSITIDLNEDKNNENNILDDDSHIGSDSHDINNVDENNKMQSDNHNIINDIEANNVDHNYPNDNANSISNDHSESPINNYPNESPSSLLSSPSLPSSSSSQTRNENIEINIIEIEREEEVIEIIREKGQVILHSDKESFIYFLSSVHFWVIIMQVILVTTISEFTEFTVLFIADVLSIDTARAGYIDSFRTFGSTLALFFGGVFYDKLKGKWLTIFLMGCLITTFLSFLVITSLMFFGMLNEVIMTILFFLFGITFTIPYYLPSAIYSTKYGGAKFCASLAGVFDGFGYGASIAMDVLAGTLSEKYGWNYVALAITAISFFAIGFTGLYQYYSSHHPPPSYLYPDDMVHIDDDTNNNNIKIDNNNNNNNNDYNNNINNDHNINI